MAKKPVSISCSSSDFKWRLTDNNRFTFVSREKREGEKWREWIVRERLWGTRRSVFDNLWLCSSQNTLLSTTDWLIFHSKYKIVDQSMRVACAQLTKDYLNHFDKLTDLSAFSFSLLRGVQVLKLKTIIICLFSIFWKS